MKVTTLNDLARFGPCRGSWERLLKGLGTTKRNSDPLPLKDIYRILGLEDALWAVRTQSKNSMIELACRYDEAWGFDSEKVAEAVKETREFVKGKVGPETLKHWSCSWGANAAANFNDTPAYIGHLAYSASMASLQCSLQSFHANERTREEVFLKWAGE